MISALMENRQLVQFNWGNLQNLQMPQNLYLRTSKEALKDPIAFFFFFNAGHVMKLKSMARFL